MPFSWERNARARVDLTERSVDNALGKTNKFLQIGDEHLLNGRRDQVTRF